MKHLTVKGLISALKKMPPDAIIVWQDHDHSANEYNDFVRYVDDVSEEISRDGISDSVTVIALRG